MKIREFIIAVLSVLVISSCSSELETPMSIICGHLVYDGDALPMDGSPEADSPLVILTRGRADSGPGLYVDASGRFQQKMLRGKYQLTRSTSPFPFEMPEFELLDDEYGYNRMDVNLLYGVTTIDFKVVPYYLMDNFHVWYDKGTDAVKYMVSLKRNGDSDLKGMIPDIVSVHLMAGPTVLVNSMSGCLEITELRISAQETTINLSLPISSLIEAYPDISLNDSTFYRLAVELEGIPNNYLFSKTVMISGIR